MDENGGILVSHAIYKLYNSICKARLNKVKVENIKELELLKAKCKSENIQISLVACTTFVKLVEDGILDSSNTLTMFMSMLPTSTKITSVIEGIIGLLLLDLKRKHQSGKNEKYICPFGLKPPQHPLIILLQNDGRNVNILVNKINGICNHHDKEIANHSIEFLRPVYLFILCNPIIIPDSKTLWTALLAQTDWSADALNLVYEILSWSRTNSSSNSLYNNILLTEAIEFMYYKKNTDFLTDMIVYLVAMLKDLCLNGYDPRPTLNLILKILHEINTKNCYFYNIILTLFAEIIHIIPAIYVSELIRVLMFMIVTENSGNFSCLYMIVDALIQLIAYPSFISKELIEDIQYLIQYIKSKKYKENKRNKETYLYKSKTKYYHPDISLAYDLCMLTESDNGYEEFTLLLKHKSQILFATKINLYLRALFLSNELSENAWINVFEILLNIVEINEKVAIGFLITVLYKLANEINPNAQKLLLQGIVKFGTAKENIPIILNTLKALSQTELKAFCLDLYLRLWNIHPRTYPILHKQLLETDKNKQWEHDIIKAITIKEICLKNPSHGTDLVTNLSDILNRCKVDDGETATSLVIDAITVLCENNKINIVSTWKALSPKFHREKRIKVIQSLCKLFAKFPDLKSPTLDYENLLNELILKLWNYVVCFDQNEIISAALDALKNYNLECMTLKHLPDIFRQNLKIPSSLAKTPIDASKDPIEIFTYIPAECWIQLLRNVNHSAIESAADIISHHIYNEILEYRGGVYLLPEGRPEPSDLKSLPSKSILSAIVSYVITQSKQKELENELIIVNCLRILSKKYSKPIPPLNWCFLHELFHRNFEMRKYCVIIAANQTSSSGSAKRLIENYLLEFDHTNDNKNDLFVLYDVLENLSNGGVETHILKTFINNCTDFSYTISKENLFKKDCLFEKTLESYKNILPLIKNEENLKNFIEIMEKYLDIIDIDSNIFPKFVETFCALPMETVESLTSPNTWWEPQPHRLRKSTKIRCFLVQKESKVMVNPLYWLNPIIDTENNNVDEIFILKSIGKTFFTFAHNKLACDWIIELLGQIQSILASGTNNSSDIVKCGFLCDVFVVAIIMFSGTGSLFCNLNTIIDSQEKRLDLFPESLHLLCEREYWRESETKIYELLYHMYFNPDIPNHLTTIFKQSLIISKNHNYFEQKAIWTKYVCLRK